jgi:hypothetical protein
MGHGLLDHALLQGMLHDALEQSDDFVLPMSTPALDEFLDYDAGHAWVN